eukprot:TRINITY_DN4735_c1_g1_i1.p1 TRINITY_DN4735_c1_g1~~TRINITY_DN4735_c1_g1_i1.p1  ORF type:complete len:206 (-),score=33.27 TRINITY_DN4735_c1_g1_i1:3-620(-)
MLPLLGLLFFFPCPQAFLFSLPLEGLCLTEPLFPDQLVTGWFRPNLILQDKQLFLEVYFEEALMKRYSANIHAHNISFEFLTEGAGTYSFCFQEMKNNGYGSEQHDIPHYSLVHMDYGTIHLHNHFNQQLNHTQLPESDDRSSVWLYKFGQMTERLEQIHVDMIKFNHHSISSINQLCELFFCFFCFFLVSWFLFSPYDIQGSCL